MWSIRTDKDGSLANIYKFNKLLLKNDLTLEIPAGHVSKLDKIIEWPHQDPHVKKRIAMGLTKDLPKEICFL